MSIFALAAIALGIVFWLSRWPRMSEGVKKGLQIVSVVLFLVVLATLGYALYLVT
ncbi:MAG: hypothetical protein ACEQSB_05810 [Undibacterium sp.]